jgi:polysaccharide deacetylase family protein (PEP-CTERM system associated)
MIRKLNPEFKSKWTNIFTVDVEDWYHILDIPSAPPQSAWDKLPSHVEANFLSFLDLFSERNVRVTCFFLGWIAEHFPQLVREAVKRGHEVASHGYAHRLVFQMSRQQFYEDAVTSRKLLEDVAGVAVQGYRAAGFSSTKDSPWFFEELVAAGYRYDSSIFPAKRGHGGNPVAQLEPYVVATRLGSIIEFPVTVADCFGKRLCFFGGGYLRVFPYWLIRAMANRVNDSGRVVNFYVHPREIDPEHPRLSMSFPRRFKSYVNLGSTRRKVGRILTDFSCTSFSEYLKSHGEPQTRVTVDSTTVPEVFLDDEKHARAAMESPHGALEREKLACDWGKARNSLRHTGSGD